jgi:hypothetical protein
VWIKFDLFYNRLYFLNQKIKSSGFVAAMWAHSYLAMTHLNAEGDERIKQDYLATKYCWFNRCFVYFRTF